MYEVKNEYLLVIRLQKIHCERKFEILAQDDYVVLSIECSCFDIFSLGRGYKTVPSYRKKKKPVEAKLASF